MTRLNENQPEGACKSSCIVATGQTFDSAFDFISSVLPEGRFRKIVIKPNWVKHQDHPEFPIAALVTDTRVIEAVIDACLAKYCQLEQIIVGDVPLQSCNWDLLAAQVGLSRLLEKYQNRKPLVRFCDLRRERFRAQNGFYVPQREGVFGDPDGYREVALGERSFLEPISEESLTFRVSNYDPAETTSSHSRGTHKYLIAGSALDCDLFINLPKLKCHQKTAVTGALKNLVGINGNKAFLVHYKHGTTAHGGDEFPPHTSPLVILGSRISGALQKRSSMLFHLLRPFWLLTKKTFGITTEGTRANLSKNFFIGSGSWYGNDTIWRMVYDLNQIILYVHPNGGELARSAQRAYISIMDGIIAGEGNGPLQPLPVDLGVLIATNDPFLGDMVMAKIMGFDYLKIPMLANHRLFNDQTWGNFNPSTVPVVWDNKLVTGIDSIPILRNFLPPPGWRAHVELPAEAAVTVS